MKIRPEGAEVFHADGETYRQKSGREDGQTDMTKLTVFFLQFCKRVRRDKTHGVTSYASL